MRVSREAPQRNAALPLSFPIATASARASLPPKRKTSKAPREPGRSRAANLSRWAVYPNARLCARTFQPDSRVDFSRGRRGHELSLPARNRSRSPPLERLSRSRRESLVLRRVPRHSSRRSLCQSVRSQVSRIGNRSQLRDARLAYGRSRSESRRLGCAWSLAARLAGSVGRENRPWNVKPRLPVLLPLSTARIDNQPLKRSASLFLPMISDINTPVIRGAKRRGCRRLG